MIGENQGLCVFPLYIQYITNYYIKYIVYIYYIHTDISHTYSMVLTLYTQSKNTNKYYRLS